MEELWQKVKDRSGPRPYLSRDWENSIVVRVEHTSILSEKTPLRTGPYREHNISFCAQDLFEHLWYSHPSPMDTDFWPIFKEGQHFCAFRNLGQLDHWFNYEHRELLETEGFELSYYLCSAWHTTYQSFIDTKQYLKLVGLADIRFPRKIRLQNQPENNYCTENYM